MEKSDVNPFMGREDVMQNPKMAEEREAHDDNNQQQAKRKISDEKDDKSAVTLAKESAKKTYQETLKAYQGTLRTFRDVKQKAFDRYVEAWESLLNYKSLLGNKASDMQNILIKTYDTAKTKYDEAKTTFIGHGFTSVENAEKRYNEAKRNVRENVEKYRSWIFASDVYDSLDLNILEEMEKRFKAIQEAIEKYNECKTQLQSLYQDMYDDAVREYTSSKRRIERAKEMISQETDTEWKKEIRKDQR